MKGTVLCHYGIKGQKHGERRFQNEDGTLTPAGRERYGVGDGNERVSKADAQKQLFKETRDQFQNKSFGKRLGQVAATGISGSTTYSMARASGHNKFNSWLRSVADINLSRIANVGAQLFTVVMAGNIAKYSNTQLTQQDMRNVMSIASAIGTTTELGITKSAQKHGHVISMQQRKLVNERIKKLNNG